MKKFYLYLILMFLILPLVYAQTDYFLDRMNFPPGESRLHRINVYNDGAGTAVVNVTVPAGFTAGGTSCAYPAPGGVFVCTVLANSSNYAYVSSPSTCTEGTIYNSILSGNISASLTYVCIPDNKIVDYKVEYGHGDANYLSENYISNETSTLFNLIRIFNIGHYLSPNEDAVNANIGCSFENYTVRTYGRTEISYNLSNVISNFFWSSIEGGYWFRIGVVGQEFTGEPIGQTYDVNCGEMSYNFSHEGVIVPNLSYGLEVRTCNPLEISFSDYASDLSKVKLNINNLEKYSLFDLYFEKILNGFSEEQHVIQLFPNQTSTLLIDRNNTYDYTFYFIPSWYRNSRNPQYCLQSFYFNGSIGPVIDPLNPIPGITFQEDTIFSGLDLDNHVFDIDGNDSSLNWTASTTDNLTIIINSTTHVLTIIPDPNFYGNRTVVFNVTDPDNLSDNQSVLVTVLPVNDLPFISPIIPTQLRAPGSGSFILNLSGYENDIDDTNLTWSVLGVDDLCVDITINTSGYANITSLTNLPCQDIVTFVLSDNKNASGQQDVEIRYNGTLDLIEGWNLISFPLLVNLSVVKVLAPLGNGNFGCGRNSSNISICNSSNGDFNGTWNSVQTYNTTSGEFLVFNPTDYYLTIPDGQEFQTFDVLKGYWIEMTGNDTLELNFANS